MKKLLLGVVCFVAFTHLKAQEITQDSTIIPSDTIIEVKKPIITFESGVFGQVGVEITPILSSFRPMTNLELGIQYKALFAGFGVHDFKGTITSYLVFPNQFTIAYRYGAANLGVRVLQTRFVELQMRCNYGLGDVVWQNDQNGENFIRDEFRMFHPELLAFYSPIPYAKLFIQAGYKKMNGLKLAKLEEQDFSGLTIGIGLRCGIYQK
ncbi:MAG: hypothetical protein CMB89_12715 [Flammeovirgaceae bacterium]|nr:hypothetical protein [Flammeovirgaceae bacterium]